MNQCGRRISPEERAFSSLQGRTTASNAGTFHSTVQPTSREGLALSTNDDSGAVALYWDFENLHAGVLEAKYGEGVYSKPDNRFKPQEPVLDVQALVALGASFGSVAINRAYGN